MLGYEQIQVSDLAVGLDTDPSFISLTELRSHLNNPPNRVRAVGMRSGAGMGKASAARAQLNGAGNDKGP